MERIKKVGQTLYNHKKKVIFVSLIAAYGVDYARLAARDANIRSFYAKQALKFGEETISAEIRPKRLTVLVNKSAGSGAGITNFKKNGLPLLHLAGIAVNVITVDNAEQLTSLCKVLDGTETDGIMVVGGDGTVNLALAGLAERTDGVNLPLGIFPGGKCNKGLRMLVPAVFRETDDVRYQCESAMAVVEESTRQVKPIRVEITSVVEPEPVTEEDAPPAPPEAPAPVVEVASEDNQTVATIVAPALPVPEPAADAEVVQYKKETLYTIADVSDGWFSYIDDRKWKFWYWGSLKRRFAYFWEMVKNSPREVRAEVVLRDYCSGCNKCRTTKVDPPPVWRWWHVLSGTPKAPKKDEKEKNYSQIVNEGCGRETAMCTQGTDVLIVGEQHEDACSLRLRVGGTFANRWGVMSDGWTRTSDNYIVSSATPGFYSTDLIASCISVRYIECPEILKKLFVGGEIKDFEPEKSYVRIEPIERSIYLYVPKHTRIGLDAL